MRIDINERPCTNLENNKKYYFYYDETNNHRKFWLDKEGFNASIKDDFILGGVLHCNEHSNANVSELKSKVRLQKTAKEIKFHHLIKKGDDFLKCLNRKNIKIFLEWLTNTDLFIHFFNINNFYFGLVDIIDTIYVDTNMRGMEEILMPMKNELFKLAICYYDEFYTYLKKYSFPNIEDVDGFCNELIGFIERYDVDNSNFIIETLRQILKQARKKEELIFLQKNKRDTIIHNYYNFYLSRIITFANSVHTFDEEFMVQAEFENIELFDNNMKLDNFKFVESYKNELVQVSDCVVGILGKFYIWINSIDFDYIKNLDKNLNEEQKNTLSLLAQLIKKSENECIYNINSIESIDEKRKCSEVLIFALEYEKEKRIKNFLKNKINK